jgi:HK97 family phage prohead protease
MSIKKQVFVSEIKSIDEKEFTLTAAISTNAVDRMGEVLDPKGLDMKNYQKNPVVLWAHDYSQPPIGKAMWVRRDGDTVVSKVKFANTPFAQEIFELYKGGFMKAFSVGFVPKDYVEGDGKKTPRTTYTKWELLEYSAVPVPANPEAVALAMQKGILKTEAIKKSLEAKPEEEWEEPLEEVSEPLDADFSGLNELIAENNLLKEQNAALAQEVTEWKYKVYIQLNKQKPSEITVDDLESKTLEILNGVIRKHQGTV